MAAKDAHIGSPSTTGASRGTNSMVPHGCLYVGLEALGVGDSVWGFLRQHQ